MDMRWKAARLIVLLGIVELSLGSAAAVCGFVKMTKATKVSFFTSTGLFGFYHIITGILSIVAGKKKETSMMGIVIATNLVGWLLAWLLTFFQLYWHVIVEGECDSSFGRSDCGLMAAIAVFNFILSVTSVGLAVAGCVANNCCPTTVYVDSSSAVALTAIGIQLLILGTIVFIFSVIFAFIHWIVIWLWSYLYVFSGIFNISAGQTRKLVLFRVSFAFNMVSLFLSMVSLVLFSFPFLMGLGIAMSFVFCMINCPGFGYDYQAINNERRNDQQEVTTTPNGITPLELGAFFITDRAANSDPSCLLTVSLPDYSSTAPPSYEDLDHEHSRNTTFTGVTPLQPHALSNTNDAADHDPSSHSACGSTVS